MTKIMSINEAILYIKNGTSLMFGGFGGIGNPPTVIKAILDYGIKDLTLIGNDAGFPHVGIGQLITAKRAKKLIASHIGSNPNAGKQMNDKTDRKSTRLNSSHVAISSAVFCLKKKRKNTHDLVK